MLINLAVGSMSSYGLTGSKVVRLRSMYSIDRDMWLLQHSNSFMYHYYKGSRIYKWGDTPTQGLFLAVYSENFHHTLGATYDASQWVRKFIHLSGQ